MNRRDLLAAIPAACLATAVGVSPLRAAAVRPPDDSDWWCPLGNRAAALEFLRRHAEVGVGEVKHLSLCKRGDSYAAHAESREFEPPMSEPAVRGPQKPPTLAYFLSNSVSDVGMPEYRRWHLDSHTDAAPDYVTFFKVFRDPATPRYHQSRVWAFKIGHDPDSESAQFRTHPILISETVGSNYAPIPVAYSYLEPIQLTPDTPSARLRQYAHLIQYESTEAASDYARRHASDVEFTALKPLLDRIALRHMVYLKEVWHLPGSFGRVNAHEPAARGLPKGGVASPERMT